MKRKYTLMHMDCHAPVVVPAEVLAERNRRLGAAIDPILEITGDPPPGYSALERGGKMPGRPTVARGAQHLRRGHHRYG
jgi:hypothetical protein